MDGRIFMCVPPSILALNDARIYCTSTRVTTAMGFLYLKRWRQSMDWTTTYSTMANFFDYDNDGDLDVYITVNEIVEGTNPSEYRKPVTDGSWPSTGRLYRNDWNDSLGHALFSNVSMQAGITIEGYGHSATIADFNRDGWKDIFVANDFLSNDILYINNHNGTFTNKVSAYFKHTSANGMGADVININNDGLADVVEMDMD